MTISLTHAFVSTKSDGADPTDVQPSYWNADHVLAQMPGTVLGAIAGGGGETVELPVSIGSDGSATFGTTASVTLAVGTTGQRPVTPAAGMIRFNLDAPPSMEYFNGTLWVTITSSIATGVRMGFTGKKTSCPAGWVVSDGGTIGNAASNGTNRANADTQMLFTLLYNDYSDANLPMQTSGGVVVPRATYASAALAFAANSAMQTVNYTDVFATGVGGTNAPLPGVVGGGATVLVAANLPQHTHGIPGAAYGETGTPSGAATGSVSAMSVITATDSGTTLTTPPTAFNAIPMFAGEVAIVKL
jgi:hypothetical protein